jgi:hypothetical protein
MIIGSLMDECKTNLIDYHQIIIVYLNMGSVIHMLGWGRNVFDYHTYLVVPGLFADAIRSLGQFLSVVNA